MSKKPTYEELEKRIKELEKKVADHRQIEETLIQIKEEWESTFNAVPDLISIIDDKHRIVRVNKAMADRLGISPEKAAGATCYEHVHGTEEPPTFCPHTKSLLDSQEHITEVHEERLGGYFLVSVTPLHDITGRVIGCVHVARDITERKIAEEEKTKLLSKLKQARKMEAIGKLAGGIAHDFNNILGIILGNTELAIDDIPKWSPAHFNLEEIKAATLRAKDVVRKLLSFGRKTDGRELKPIEIVPVVKNALKFIRSTIPTTIDIRQNILVTDETILAVPTQISQVIMNLCVNSYHAMDQTGGVIEINMERTILDEEGVKSYPDLNEGHYFKITVSDTGPGLDAEIIDQIFDPYFTTKEVGKGSGMGLAVVHGIVKNHNGAISVASEAGKGTTFTVLFPLAERMPEIETYKTEELSLGKETILVVDDEKSIVNMSRRMLERLGYKVEATTSPIEALALFRSKPGQYDLIITDMTMPSMTGDKLVKEILNIRPDMPTIICTGFSDKIDAEKAKEIGATGYLEKPHEKSDIARVVRQVLDRKEG
ncbi:MAG: response regulator [Proteobacteria bacterium]|nr:response regulator [Pseudomonadota bacterium]